MRDQFRVIDLPLRFRLPVAGRSPEGEVGQAPETALASLPSLPSLRPGREAVVRSALPPWGRYGGQALAVLTLLAVCALPGSAVERTARAVLAVTCALLCTRRARRSMATLRDRKLLRRDWEIGCRRAGLVNREGRVPKVRAVHDVPAGERLLVCVPPGRSVTELLACAGSLAKALGVPELRVLAEPDRARTAHVTLVRRDPLAGRFRLLWPLRGGDQVSLWDPVPVGIDEEGRMVSLSLPGRNLLIGGESATGKSTALSLPLGAAALDPNVDLSLLDGKLVGLAPLHGCAQRVAGPDLDEAVDVLLALQAELHRRLKLLLHLEKRRFEPSDDVRLHVLACDELDDYLDSGRQDHQRVRQFGELISELALWGRATGIIVLATLRRPSPVVLPTPLRDAFRYRCVLTTASAASSDAILGNGWTARGVTATQVPTAQPGVGHLLDVERATPVRLRWFALRDEDQKVIHQRARLLRAAWNELQTASALCRQA